MHRHDHSRPLPRRSVHEPPVGGLDLGIGTRLAGFEVELVSFRACAPCRERDDDLAADQPIEILDGESHASPVNQIAAATRMARPATKEARIK